MEADLRTRDNADRATAETLAFVLPGLVHHLGNVLLAIQGHTATATAENLAEAQRAVLTAAGRGGHGLEILRCLLGEATPSAADPAPLLEQLGELLRIPVRGRKQLLDVKLPQAASSRVDRADFVMLVVEALQRLVAVVPEGVRGTVTLELAATATGRTAVRLQFATMAGELPFPLPLAGLQQALRSRAQRSRAGATCRLAGQAIEIEWQ